MPKLLGKSYEYWQNNMGVSEEELAGYFQDMIRNTATTQRQSINRVGEITSAKDLPLSAQLSMERGATLSSQRAITAGTESLQRYASEANRQAWSAILGAELSEERMKLEEEMADEQFWASIIGSVASAAGEAAGAGVF